MLGWSMNSQSQVRGTVAVRWLILVCCIGVLNASTGEHVAAQDEIPAQAVREEALGNSDVEVFRLDNRLFLKVQPDGQRAKRVSLPRLYAEVRRWGWMGDHESQVNLQPEPNDWIFSWSAMPPDHCVVELELELASDHLERPEVGTAGADGSIWLPAHQARTVGTRLRFEPQPHKNTVGYWTDATDHAAWTFQVDRPGHFAVAILQGCGAGQGGSDAEITVSRDATAVAQLPFQVEETGHFQNFRWRTIGQLELKSAGPHELKLSAIKIANAALVDVRAIHLVRQATAEK